MLIPRLSHLALLASLTALTLALPTPPPPPILELYIPSNTTTTTTTTLTPTPTPQNTALAALLTTHPILMVGCSRSPSDCRTRTSSATELAVVQTLQSYVVAWAGDYERPHCTPEPFTTLATTTTFYFETTATATPTWVPHPWTATRFGA